MKAKIIKSVLRNKFNGLLASIEDEAVKEAVRRDGIITGGCIASMLLGEKINDFDVYFKNEDTVAAVAEYYVAKWKANPPTRFKDGEKRTMDIFVVREDGRVKIVVKSAGVASESGADDYQYFESADPQDAAEFVKDAAAGLGRSKENKGKPKYRPVFLTSNCITLSDDVQLVTRFYGPVNEIHENYDFIHCTCSWDAETGELVLPPAALESLLSKELRYKRSKYPLCSIIRTRKFLARGWRINAGQYVKMGWDLSKLDLSDPAILEDQMIGVDAAYFRQVIDLLKEKGGESIDEVYLMEVIDMVF